MEEHTPCRTIIQRWCHPRNGQTVFELSRSSSWWSSWNIVETNLAIVDERNKDGRISQLITIVGDSFPWILFFVCLFVNCYFKKQWEKERNSFCFLFVMVCLTYVKNGLEILRYALTEILWNVIMNQSRKMTPKLQIVQELWHQPCRSIQQKWPVAHWFECSAAIFCHGSFPDCRTHHHPPDGFEYLPEQCNLPQWLGLCWWSAKEWGPKMPEKSTTWTVQLKFTNRFKCQLGRIILIVITFSTQLWKLLCKSKKFVVGVVVVMVVVCFKGKKYKTGVTSLPSARWLFHMNICHITLTKKQNTNVCLVSMLDYCYRCQFQAISVEFWVDSDVSKSR